MLSCDIVTEGVYSMVYVVPSPTMSDVVEMAVVRGAFVVVTEIKLTKPLIRLFVPG